MKQYFTIAAARLLAALFISPATFAGVIIQPVSASTDMGTSVGSPDNVINQSGLSVGYTSGMSDFDDYYFSTPGHNSLDNSAIWASGSPFLVGNFDFDLGGVVLIESMILWNCDNQRAVYGFNLLADDNPAFSSPTVLGSFLVDNDGPGDRMAPHPLPFAPTLASNVRMEITSNNGPDSLDVRMGEIAFEQVPEPTLLALLGLGGLVSLRRARRADGLRGAASAFLAFSLGISTGLADWPMHRGAPQLQGVTSITAPAKPELAWTFKAGGPVKGAAAIAMRRVFFGDDVGGKGRKGSGE